jgi:hypothetical protein
MRALDCFVADVLPVALTRTYQSGDTIKRPFGIGATHNYDLHLWSAKQYEEADLILPDGSRIHYERTSAGTSFADAEFHHAASPGAFYDSRIVWNGGGWDLLARNGNWAGMFR